MRVWRLAWSGKFDAPGGCKFIPNMDQAQGQGTIARNALGFGRMDHGAVMEIMPIDMILFAMFVALAAMWMDQ